MKIIGFIRFGDKTACGGIVSEGLGNHIRFGQPISFQGARISCRRHCVIAEGLGNMTLDNGKAMCIHGHVSSNGCPIYSTLNDIDGIGNEGGAPVAAKHYLNDEGEWEPDDSPASPIAASSQVAAVAPTICLECLAKAAASGSAMVVRE